MQLPTANRKALLIAAVVLGVVVLEVAATSAYLAYKKSGRLPWSGIANLWTSLVSRVPGRQVSTDILFLTDPVFRFTGTVDKVEGNSVWVTRKNMQAGQADIPPPVPPGKETGPQPSKTPVPTQTIKDITYKVTVTENTLISRPPLTLPFFLQDIQGISTDSSDMPVSDETQQPSVTDIRVGLTLDITSVTDLRSLTRKEFEAAAIILPSPYNVINGTVTSVSGNTIVVTAIPDPATAIKQEYTVTVGDDTQIAYISDSEVETVNQRPKPTLLKLSDLHSGMTVNVYAKTDLTGVSSFTAAVIEPSLSTAPPKRNDPRPERIRKPPTDTDSTSSSTPLP